MNMTVRLWVGVFVLAALTWVGKEIYLKGQPTAVTLPTVKLEDLPRQFGPWVGTDTELDPRVFKHSEALVAVNRIYRKPGDAKVTLHAAIWDRADITPHAPQECYAGAGFQLLSHKDLKLRLPDESTQTARYLVFERDHEDVCVLYWYHFGHTLVVDRDSLRDAQFAARDAESWPAIVKVMMQTSGPSSEKTESRLRELGQLVLAWTDKMYPPSASSATAKQSDTSSVAPPAKAPSENAAAEDEAPPSAPADKLPSDGAAK